LPFFVSDYFYIIFVPKHKVCKKKKKKKRTTFIFLIISPTPIFTIL
jgi:hypothetical protein